MDFTEAFASDLDEFACQTIEANSRPLKFYRGKVDGDITKRDNSQAPSCDVYLAGFPCQPHSSEGKKRGFQDPRGQVFYGVVDYLRTHKPRVAKFASQPRRRRHLRGSTPAAAIGLL